MQLTFSPKRLNKRSRIQKAQSKVDNPEKLATQGTQDEDKQNKNTTRNVLDTTMRKQAQITSIRHEVSYKRTEHHFYADIVKLYEHESNIVTYKYWPIMKRKFKQ